MKKLLTASLVFALPLLSCTAEPEIFGPAEPVGIFAEGPCPMPIPEGLIEGESVKCGTVPVPEFHSRVTGKTFKLPVAIFPSIAQNPSPSPLFVATAGPGASGIESITPEVAGPLGPALLSQSDFVLIDYRGLPLAEPNLLCPEVDGFRALNSDQDPASEKYLSGHLQAAAICRDRLRAEGVNLDAFNNTETAADIAMVMSALGYDTFNVYGTSAGTILAQHLLRDFPDRVRSVIIDSTVPIGRGNVHTEAPTISAGMLDEIVGLCESDAACAGAYPDLRQEATDLIADYSREPLTIPLTHAMPGEPTSLLFTGHRVAQSLQMLNTQTSTVPLVPWYIHELAGRNGAIMQDFLWTMGTPGRFSWALGTSVFCIEYSDFTEQDVLFPGIFPEYEEALATQPFGAQLIARTCKMWGVEPMDFSRKQPVRSDVPVLLMAGQLDALTPPAWAREVAETLDNAFLFEIPGYAHSPTFGGECPASMALQFLADPTQAPDASCLDSLRVEFAVKE